MTDYELLRIISFLERVRSPFDENLSAAKPDFAWNAVLFLIKSHIRGDLVTMSSLALTSKIPFPSAMRRIHEMIKDGNIEKTAKKGCSKSFVLKPSAELKQNFVTYALEIKMLLAEIVGLGSDADHAEDYYFGGGHLAQKLLPPRPPKQDGLGRDLRFLLHDDNYFNSMCNLWSDFRSKLLPRRNFHMHALQELHAEISRNARLPSSEYDIIAVNIPWVGEAVSKGMVRPLDDLIELGGINPLDFQSNVWATGRWDSKQYGIPIYCTIETLAVRKDLFEQRKLSAPSSFDKVLAAAKELHQPHRGMSGIVWNAARGMPIAHSFMFFLGCCKASVIDLPTSRIGFDASKMKGEMYRPNVLSEAGHQTLDYMHRLLAFSPPDVLTMDWNRALDHFMTGNAAMIYCWTMRASRFEYDFHSVVKRKVEYHSHPHGPGGASYGPVGGFLLMIPSRLSEDRARVAFEAISWMASPAAMKEHVKNGIPVAPGFSVTADSEAAATTSIIRMVDRLARQNRLQTWQRPPIPEYRQVERILGERIFAALSGETTDEVALEQCQNEIDSVMRSAGYY